MYEDVYNVYLLCFCNEVMVWLKLMLEFMVINVVKWCSVGSCKERCC